MEPYYTKAEQMYQVHGARGEDPTEPPASAPYPFPAVSHEPRIQKLSDDLARAGYRPFHTPNGIMLNEENMPFSTCVRCKDCDGFPCLVHAKSDAEVCGCTPGAAIFKCHPADRFRGSQAENECCRHIGYRSRRERGGQTETFQGSIVVVSCGAANSARLLLMSANDKHPNGLANGSDQVGRNYMYHNSQAVLAISKEPNPTKFQKTLGVNDFYHASKEFPFPLGNLQMVGKSQGPMYKARSPSRRDLRRCGHWTRSPNMRLISGFPPRICPCGKSRHDRSRRDNYAKLYADE